MDIYVSAEMVIHKDHTKRRRYRIFLLLGRIRKIQFHCANNEGLVPVRSLKTRGHKERGATRFTRVAVLARKTRKLLETILVIIFSGLLP